MKNLVLTALAAGMLTASPAAAQSNPLLNLLGRFVKPASAHANPMATPSAAVTPTAAQSAAIHDALQTKQMDPKIAQDIASAAPLIEKIARTSACGVNDTAWNDLNRESVAPRSWDDLKDSVARHYDEYHDPRYCYDVVRISEFEKPAANALSFKIFFVSPTSQHASTQEFTILHTTEGAWLLKEFMNR